MKKFWPNKKRMILVPGLVLVVISFAFFSFQTSREFKYTKSLDIFFTLFRELNLYYVDETDPEELVHTAIDHMLESLDPYTTYIPESDLDELNLMTTGKYGGIGSLVRKNGEYAVISEVYRGFPADEAGIRPGDIILEVDRQSIRNMPLEKVSDMLKGLPNTSVEILFSRPETEKPFRKTLERQVIHIPSVPYAGIIDEGIGYIRLSNFTRHSATEVKNAFLSLKKEADLRGLILDLRSNPGGLLMEAVDVSNIFVERGQEIVSTHGKVEQWDHTYRTRFAPVDTEIPLTILVNRSSASASEIVAGALQDLDRGVVVGQRTFGKGLVQTTRPLSYNAQLKVTTAKYYIPSGRCIQALDYSHRNEDGSVGHIPDSLISEYQTRNGRTVYGGGGIMPDVEVEPLPLSRISYHLYVRNLIFDFATLYALHHPDIPEPRQFSISDSTYRAFGRFINDRNFDYLSKTEETLKELISHAKKEKYYEPAAEEITRLKKIISHNKEQDLITFREEIENLLEEEIAKRYYYQEGSIAASLDHDNQIQTAVQILNNRDQYASLLQPGPHQEIRTASRQN